jgi:hypothetical protein
LIKSILIKMATTTTADAIFELGDLGESSREGTRSHRTSRTKSDLEDDAAVMNRIGRPALMNVRGNVSLQSWTWSANKGLP